MSWNDRAHLALRFLYRLCHALAVFLKHASANAQGEGWLARTRSFLFS
jgi:hypothetical protein